MKRHIISALFVFSFVSVMQAKEIANTQRVAAPRTNRVMAGCDASKSSADLDVNNVRTRIWINGDMWWDLSGTPIYEIPRNSRKHSMFAGAIWVGGKDNGGNLKVAAQTYRQSGSDFWPGAIDTATVTISADACLRADRHFQVSLSEVREFHQKYQIEGDVNYPVPPVIRDWPGNGDPQFNQQHLLAPFYDRSGDGVYDYNDGDYPKYRLDPSIDPCDKNQLLGDQTIWWVFNDVGNIHGETSSPAPIGLEIQAQAFGFNTNDEINNMTFYRYKIINRASTVLRDTYFGSWVDPDLGFYLDDYVGCDVGRGLGFCYNGDDIDEGATGYGTNPPAIGLDFFEGPIADANDGIDNNRNGVVDEPGEQIIMAKFVYYNNDFLVTGNPVTATDYYNYLDGIWKDNLPLTFGGTGYNPGSIDTCDFMFPGDSDPMNIGTNGIDYGYDWSETVPTLGGSPNNPADRRFLQSAGKFTLVGGAVNYITTGAVWARTSSGGASASLKLLKLADVKAQNLFESCFRLMDGPDAPELSIRELNREILISWSNPSTSNNVNEAYTEKDNNIPSIPDAIFQFEGYKIYQVKDGQVTTNDLKDADKARLIFECDITNGIKQIVNQVFDGDLNAFIPSEEVFGQDKGLKHSMRVTQDAFATGDAALINHKTYYFMAIAFAYDSVAEIFDPYFQPRPGLFGQPYIQSRKGPTGSAVSVYTAIPHIPAPEALGLVLNTSFGDGPEITRYTGFGNGYTLGSDRATLDIKQEQVDQMIYTPGQNIIQYPTYYRGRGPVDIRIFDPVKVPPADFELWLTDTAAQNGVWVLRNVTTGQIDTSEKTIEFPYDQLFKDYGFSVNLTQVKNPGEDPNNGNSFIEGTISFSNPNNRWLSGISDLDMIPNLNWILSGKRDAAAVPPNWEGLDEQQYYEKILGGTWAPYNLVNRTSSPGEDYIAPADNFSNYSGQENGVSPDTSLRYVNSIDVVITPDRSKWSRCVVFEMGNDISINEGGQYKNLIRKTPSKDINGNVVPDDPTTSNDSGFSYFPGYAINVETGERLNIAFGEDSRLFDYGGKDMTWNPNSVYFDTIQSNFTLIAGGKHYIYVFGNRRQESMRPDNPTYYGPAYDGCQFIHDKMWGTTVTQVLTNAARRREVIKAWKDCMWVGVPVLASGQNLLDNEVKIRLRVAKPYRQYDTGSYTINNNYPFYKFNTHEMAAKVQQTEVAQDALSLINVVPNPYYAYSNYEANQLDNRVKIVNLPPKCVVSIFTTSGTLIRRYQRSVAGSKGDYNNTDGATVPNTNSETALEWDLKNSLGIPIASGMYLIHVQADGIGERTLKWFGVIRPIDLESF